MFERPIIWLLVPLFFGIGPMYLVLISTLILVLFFYHSISFNELLLLLTSLSIFSTTRPILMSGGI